MIDRSRSVFSAEVADLSVEPSALRGLSVEQKTRLTDIVDGYLSALESGAPMDKEELLKRHSDLAGPLRMYLKSLEDLHEAAAGFANHSSESRDEDAPRDERRLGDFRLIREIGRGGMGVVYEAHQLSLDRRVALKVLPFAAVLDSKQIARFKNEAHAAAQLDHPNIVSVFAVGVERGVHFYAMRLIDGQPLDRAIVEMRRGLGMEQDDDAAPTQSYHPGSLVDIRTAESDLDDEDTRRIARSSVLTGGSVDSREYFRTVARLGIQAADALHAAHEFGIIHRDIKPSNLLLDGDGKLWVTDFGLARCQTDVAVTRTGDVVGTMRYMSPEQASGKTELLDRRTDVYSLGATLYELLALRPAFDDQDGATLLRRIQQDEPPRLRSLQPRVPRDLETVVMKAMAKVRGERYRTARQLAEDLRRVLDGEPTEAKPLTLPQRLGKWAARRRRLVAISAALCMVAVVGMAVSMFLIAREKAKAEENYARAEKNFRDAREVVDRFGARLAQRLADVPGADQVRDELLRETLRYYQRFAEETKGDCTLEVDLATTHGKIGTLASEIGSAEDAIKAHREALTLYERLVAKERSNVDYLRRLGICGNNLGMALSRAGKTDEARNAFHEALRLQQSLIDNAEDEPQYLADLALSHNNLALLESKVGRQEAADASLREAIRFQERLLADDPENPDCLRNLAASLNNAAALSVGEKSGRTVELYQKALAYQKKAAAARPQERKYQQDVALTYNNLGTARMRANQFSEAVREYTQAIDIHRQLVRLAPASKSYQRELAVDYNNLGLAQSRLGDAPGARRAFQQALALQERLLAENPRDIDLRSALGGVYNNLGMVLENLRQTNEAAASYAKAIEHQKVAQTRAPQVARYRLFLSKHYYNHARVSRQLGRTDEAIADALARKALWPKDPVRLFTVSEELAMTVPLLADARSGKMSSEQCAAQAISTLEEAVAAGLTPPKNLYHSKSFAALKDDRRFAELAGQ